MKNSLLFILLLCSLAACKSTKKCVENPKPDCICTMQYDPVCGCNNKTYGNACAAQCAGIKTFTPGACKTDKPEWGLEGMVWQLTAFVSPKEKTLVPNDVTISMKFEGGKVDGHGGCNHVGGVYEANGDKLKVSQLISTKMFCEPAMKWETMFLQWFPEAQSYSITGETMEIKCGDKGSLMFRLNWKKRN